MRWLIAVHLVMAAAPLLQRVLLGSDFLTEWSYLVTLLPFGSAMTLSVWTGLGRASVGWRLLTGVIGTLYLGLWFTIGDVILAPGWPRMS